MKKTVIELFAGVGGFRVALNHVKLLKNGEITENNKFEFVYANQWEPSTKKQDAFECYVKRFGENDSHQNKDISTVDKKTIPDHNLLVAGFPCQDYSVARTKSNEKGIQGKKGVLWWEIHEILLKKRPPFVLLENVDRLLKSPSNQKGRDFGVMLRSLFDLGYNLEWRIINAAEYGHVQRRKRVFIFCFLNSTKYSKKTRQKFQNNEFFNVGLFYKPFPIKSKIVKRTMINLNEYKNLFEISEQGIFEFRNFGLMFDGVVYSAEVTAKDVSLNPLSTIMLKDVVSQDFFVEKKIDKFRYLKNSKRIHRKSKKTGFEYVYSEGKMTFPDDIDKPSRTMLTSEGTENRSSHVVEDFKTKKLRYLTPIEAERLNEFPDNWTNTDMSNRKRYFMMGNALVVGVVRKIGDEINKIIEKE